MIVGNNFKFFLLCSGVHKAGLISTIYVGMLYGVVCYFQLQI